MIYCYTKKAPSLIITGGSPIGLGDIAVPNDMHTFYLLNREGELGVGEGFVLQGEVPPLGVERFEAVT